MNTHFNKRLCLRQPEGVALFLTLAFLALIITLVLAFFASVSTELSSARSSVSQITARQLADTSVQVVSSMIRMATTNADSNGKTTAAWASQPGMIRVYGTGSAASSAPLRYFKLYSSDDMEITQSEMSAYDMATEVDGLWDGKKAMFTDLNSPVTDGAAKLHFPIIDPRAQTTSPATSVEGFTYDSSITTKTGAVPVSGVVLASAGTADNQRLPMPVRWIYVLKDGTLTAPRGVDATTGKIANWTGASSDKTPSAINPIVGRIAFWTDDDTSKININTAAGDLKTLESNAGGSFWDTPRAETALDRKFATSQVATNEFQRYPGHPSTIALNAVFPPLDRVQIGTLAPRTAFGGSQGGNVTNYDKKTGGDVLARKSDRLYGSVEELLFKPTVGGAQRDGNPAVTADALEKAKFFLTANNRAPDLNLFGQPRVSLWPINNDARSPSSYRTASDELLAFCTKVGGKRYHFTRGNSDGTSTSTSRTADYLLNPRNQQIYAYLRNLMGKATPGFEGGTFATKYGSLNRDQILTEIFDYIRITNLKDQTLGTGAQYTPAGSGSGQVVPIKITTASGVTKGFGRISTISEAALQFYVTATSTDPVTGVVTASKMRAVLLLEGFRPAAGYPGISPSASYTIADLEKLNIDFTTAAGVSTNAPLKFPAKAQATNTPVQGGFYTYGHNDHGGISFGFYTSGPNEKTVFGTNPVTNYPFISQTDILIPADAASMKLNEGTIHLTVNCKDASGEVVQNIALKFLAIPKLPLPKASATTSYKNYNNRINGMLLGSGWNDIIDANDVVRSLEPSGMLNGVVVSPVNGDLRLVAATETEVPDTVFTPHVDYFSDSKRLAHSFRVGANLTYPGGTSGILVKGTTYGAPYAIGSFKPTGLSDFPSSITTGAMMATTPPIQGDWDNGIANRSDGPCINKPDEGTTQLDAVGDDLLTDIPYYDQRRSDFDAATLFSPNRQIASPVMLGSLSTGVGYSPQRPWQTLLFRPDVAGTHSGSAAPKDYLLLDLFTMPIVEPYAISEPLSTAGRVNMNYQIAPFSYIVRETAIRAALQSIWTMAIPTADGPKYKSKTLGGNYRQRLSSLETLKQFQARFDIAITDPITKPSLFIAPAELCDLHLVPTGTTLAAMQAATYWDGFKLTGDNTREMPYNHLYPLLTTKSNTYTVHMRVQVLKKVRATGADVWDEGRDQVLSEYRGSSTLERYVDAADPALANFDETYTGATVRDANGNITKTGSLEPFYKIRVLSTKKFAQH